MVTYYDCNVLEMSRSIVYMKSTFLVNRLSLLIGERR